MIEQLLSNPFMLIVAFLLALFLAYIFGRLFGMLLVKLTSALGLSRGYAVIIGLVLLIYIAIEISGG